MNLKKPVKDVTIFLRGGKGGGASSKKNPYNKNKSNVTKYDFKKSLFSPKVTAGVRISLASPEVIDF